MTQDYYGTKRITAWPQPSKPDETGAFRDGYGVRYEGGYISWMPAGPFESAYQPLDALSFGHALEVIKNGGYVARIPWLETGRYIAGAVGLLTDSPKILLHYTKAGYDAYVPTQQDLFANDWVVIKDIAGAHCPAPTRL